MSEERDWVPDIPEDIVRKNLLALRQDNKMTTERCDKLEAEVKALKNLVVMLQQQVQQSTQTVNILRAQIQGSGSTS